MRQKETGNPSDKDQVVSTLWGDTIAENMLTFILSYLKQATVYLPGKYTINIQIMKKNKNERNKNE